MALVPFCSRLLSPLLTPKRPIHAAWELMLMQSETFDELLDHFYAHSHFVPDMVETRLAFDDIAELKRAAGSSIHSDVISLGELANEMQRVVRQYQQYNSKLGSAIDRAIYASNAVLRALKDAQSPSYYWNSFTCSLAPQLFRPRICSSDPQRELSVFRRVHDATAYTIQALSVQTFELAHLLDRLLSTYSATVISDGWDHNGTHNRPNSTIWDGLLGGFSGEVYVRFQQRHPGLPEMDGPMIELAARLIRMGEVVASLQRGFYHIDPSSIPLGLDRLPTRTETALYLADVRERLVAARSRAQHLRLMIKG
ncbi:hypothetical protein SISSUDRAFT_1067380 [Sistotremastrum suecicum HHB10207 ss-3]|uniref:Uncharacterized protein n=1 Tax=Sistotremastrum suecicum HHB10207 ss-3 TaxID=1314776 RepID=A0A165X6Q8_9AGAM|nr:hypothetical protein SISSUDRAFT_1067380 [Sistotremastrum suecicum HHB10207 ss-3]